MYEVKVIANYCIEPEVLTDIIDIKEAFGFYGYESQLEWIMENLQHDDLHFLLYEKKRLCGYANLVKRVLLVNNDEVDVIGVGNVCVSKDIQGRGVGSILIQRINEYISLNHVQGLLFCKDSLLKFYSGLGWTQIKLNNSSVNSLIFPVCKSFTEGKSILFLGEKF